MGKKWKRRGSPEDGGNLRRHWRTLAEAIRRLPARGRLRCVLKAAVITAAFSYVFYRSWLGTLAFPAVAALCLWRGSREFAEEQKRLLARQFTDTILSVTGSLQAGYSIENAFLEAEKEIAALHGPDSLMAEELMKIRGGLVNRIPIEQQLLRFGAQSQVEEIQDFTEVFAILKRSGGNLREMIRRTAELTGQRLEVEQEICQLLHSRRFEMKIMNVIPFCMYGYVQLTSPGFFDELYHNPAGICVMTVCLGVYLIAVWIAGNIMDIRV